MKGTGVHTHAAVKTQQRNATTGVRIRQSYAVDCRRHAIFRPQLSGLLGEIAVPGETALGRKALHTGKKALQA